MTILYASGVLVVGLWAFFLFLSNKQMMERLKKPTSFSENPLISIAIPARDEEGVIHRCVTSLIAQSYTNIEILILDDNSTDQTAEKVKKLQEKDNRVRIITGKPLKEGWRGKLYAMQQLYEASKGEYILFTDADTEHQPNSVAYGLGILINEDASMISGYPTQEGEKFWAQVVVSALLLNTVLYVPLKLQHKVQWAPFAMAIGQYLLLTRSLLDDIGGFTSISNVICDDVMLARACTRGGHKYVFADMKDALSCTMFPSFKEAFAGIERSITGVITIKAYMLPLVLLAAVVLLACALAPVATIGMFIQLLLNPSLSSLPFWLLLAGTLLLFGSWTGAGIYHRFPLQVALQGPFVFVLMVAMFLHGYYRKVTGKGFVWKGRIIS